MTASNSEHYAVSLTIQVNIYEQTRETDHKYILNKLYLIVLLSPYLKSKIILKGFQ